MQIPSTKTPVSKCLALAAYSGRMLGKATDNPRLLLCSGTMHTAAAELDADQRAYEAGIAAIVVTRVDVKYENHVSDRWISRLQKRVEMADGKRGGRIAAMVFPEGANAITRRVGHSQVQAMIDLEGRLAASAPFFAEAAAEQAACAELRQRYEAALAARKAAVQNARDLRAVRDASKMRFLDRYAEVIGLIKAEFPRDRTAQDLYFDEVYVRSTPAADDGDGPADDPDTDAEPQPGAGEPASQVAAAAARSAG